MMTTQDKIALVTGSNKGIGLEVTRQLARAGVTVILTSRDKVRGMKARNQLLEEGLTVDYQQLDTTDEASISAVAQYITEKYDKLDILINNAGILPDEDTQGLIVSRDTVRTVFETNTLGPLNVSQHLAPLLKKSDAGKIINVSSGMGSLEEMAGDHPAYRISKAALNAVTKILADELKGTHISVNSVCPGWVRTDMGGSNAMRSVEEGAAGIVKLALLQEKVPTGHFLRDLQEVAF